MNVVLVSIDSLRADHLPMYGYPRDTAPNLQRLAQLRGSRLYTRVTSPAPSCHPAHTALLTGLYPQQVGVLVCGEDVIFKSADMTQEGAVDALAEQEQALEAQPESLRRKKQSAIMNWLRIPPQTTTLPMVLQRHGFDTGGFVSIWTLQGRFGYAHGFDRFDDRMPEYYGPARLRWLLRDVYGSQLRRPGEDTLARALDFLDSTSRARPFFLFLHFADTHVPYRAPEGSRLPVMSASEHAELMRTWTKQYSQEVRERAFKRMHVGFPDSLMNRYDLAIHHTDALIGRLIDRLRSMGVFDDTLLIVVADHGDSFGEHPYLSAAQRHRLFFEHSVYVWEETQHVPVIIHDPRDHDAARRIDGNASLVDVAPTVLDALGYPTDELTPGELPGVDLLNPVPRRRVHFLTFGRGRPGLLDTIRTDYPNYIGFRDGDVKFFVDKDRFKNADKGRCFLFDLGSDPNEQHNLCALDSYRSRAVAWRAELVDWYNATLSHRPTGPAKKTSGSERSLSGRSTPAP